MNGKVEFYKDKAGKWHGVVPSYGLFCRRRLSQHALLSVWRPTIYARKPPDGMLARAWWAIV